MRDREIRENIIRSIMPDDEEYTADYFSKLFCISEQQALSNMQYLVNSNYAKSYYYLSGGFSIGPNERTISYLAEPDCQSNETNININGSQNIVAGRNMEINNSEILNLSGIPKEYESELADLLKEIRNAESPKPIQVSKAKCFFEKVAASCTSSVVASCAVAILKAAIGLP